MATSRHSHNRACSQSLVSKLQHGEPAPTLPVTEEWRRRVIAARKNANVSQEEMARKLGISQSAYSKIEAGRTVSSNLVLQICSIVSVAPPTLHTDEVDVERPSS